MANRANPYEAAFESYLRRRGVPYIAVDERRRSLWGAESIKSLDFVVSRPGAERLLIDVKGRKFPAGRRRPQYWRNWCTEEDLRGLHRWRELLGVDSVPLLLFAYNLVGEQAPLSEPFLHEHRGSLFAFVAIRLEHYAAACRTISPRWGTVAMPTAEFRRRAAPIDAFWAEECRAAPVARPLTAGH